MNEQLEQRVADAISAARYPDGTNLELAQAALKAHAEYLESQGLVVTWAEVAKFGEAFRKDIDAALAEE